VEKIISACLGCSYYGKLKLLFDTQTERATAKWFLLHERQRHAEDIAAIDKDLKMLSDVELPRTLSDVAGCVRFEIATNKPKQTLFNKHKLTKKEIKVVALRSDENIKKQLDEITNPEFVDG